MTSARVQSPAAFGFDFRRFLVAGRDEAFAGIGSRETPDVVLALMTRICERMAELGWKMRSGGAPGADQACEAGYARHPDLKEIFLPWKGFENSKSTLYWPYVSPEALDAMIERLRPTWSPKLLTGAETIQEVIANAYLLAEYFHPKWEAVKGGARPLMARNGHQMLGEKLSNPSKLVLCWTVDGNATGGTGQAIRLAEHFGVMTVNLKRPAHLAAMLEALGIDDVDQAAILSAPPKPKPVYARRR